MMKYLMLCALLFCVIDAKRVVKHAEGLININILEHELIDE